MSQLEQIRIVIMTSNKVLEKWNKQELITKLLVNNEKLKEKVITQFEKDLVNFEIQKITVGHQINY